MPFGPTNGPAMFIRFIYDIDCQWKLLETKSGISIDEDTNTRINVDDIVSHGKDMETALVYMECQLCTCLAHPLFLGLKKSHIFPQCFKFVGNDVCPNGNRPAQSKHKLLSMWPNPEIVCNIAKFIGFAQFYIIYIHDFELRIAPLHALTIAHDYTDIVAPTWTTEA